MSEVNHHPDHLLVENQIATDENVALIHAAEKGSAAGVLKCLQRGAKPNFFFRPDDQKNALHIASENGDLDVVNILLEHGSVVDCVAISSKATALILAAQKTNVEIVKVLLKAGASVHAANGYGNTPLHEAAHSGNIQIAKLLIEAGANVNIQNHKGSSPLHTFCYGASKDTHSLDFLKYLVQSGCNVNLADSRGTTPLLVCCASGRLDSISYLIEVGADPTVQDNDKRGPVEVATFYGRDAVAAYFNEDSPFRRHGGGHK